MAATRAQLRHQRVREINQAYEKTHFGFHADYKKAHADTLKEFGFNTSTPFHSLPAEVHEALAEHKADLVANLQLAQEAKISSVSTLPRIKFIRH